MNEIIKCLKCGHVLISGTGMIAILGSGASIECRKCGNKHIFGKKEISQKMSRLQNDTD